MHIIWIIHFYSTCFFFIVAGLSCSKGGYNQNQPQFGQECMYRCHCVNNGQCNYDTGECSGGCDAGWMGPGCQYGDIAYLKATWQKSTLYGYTGPEMAVDGNTSTCSQTTWQDEPWWRVDLEAMYKISGLVIHSGETGALKGFEVRVGNVSSDSPSIYLGTCFKHNITDELGEVIHVVCALEQVAQHLMILVPEKQTRINICDVRVYGGRSLAYRRAATQKSVSDGGVAARALDGGILTSYNSQTCTHTLQQPSPWWRVDLAQVYTIMAMTIFNRQDCCKGRLSGFSILFAVNNSYTLVYKYPDTTPGEKTEVTSISSDKARFVEIGLRDKTYEALTLCEVFIYGDCPDNFCGWSCESPCFCAGPIDKRNKINGICPGGCTGNWNGSKCNFCSSGWFGQNCSQQCGHCVNDSSCHHVNGTCTDGCSPGYNGSLCNTVCPLGQFGQNCSQQCGHCINDTSCHYVNGTCADWCSPGYNGSFCNTECPNSHYGYNCSDECGYCVNGTVCHHVNGVCDTGCEPGFTGNNCKLDCPYGKFGLNCSMPCGYCADNVTCHHINGTCMNGCSPGYNGTMCNQVLETQRKDNDSEMKMASIGGAVGGAISALVLIFIGSGLLLWKRRRPSSAKQQQKHLVQMKKIQSDDISNIYENASILSQEATLSKTCGHISSNKESEVETYEDHDVYYNLDKERILMENLEDYVKNGVYLSTIIEQEYEGLISGPQYDMNVASKPPNRPKNRYKEIYAYDKTRVVLDPLPDEPDSDYINACFINGYKRDKAYIAAQGPTTIIVNDFWRMIWQYNIEKIVMLTELYEQGKQKCHKYWPSTGAMKFGTIQVEIIDEDVCTEYTIRFLKVTRIGYREQKMVTQFHFTAWPDRDVPDSPATLVQFWNKVRHTGEPSDSQTLVHCSAGIGRTGTYIALDYLYDESLTAGSIHIFDCINNLRRQRVGMVQNAEQYVYLHKALQEAVVSSGKRIDVNDFPSYYQEMQGIDLKKRQKKLLVEFESLRTEELCSHEKEKPESTKVTDYGYVDEYACAKLPENKVKNRYDNIIPSRKSRPFLSSYVSGCNDYINAVCLPTRKNKHGLILTQIPLPDTVVDFWRLVFEYDVQTLVMLNEENASREKIGVYWPKGDQVCQFGPFTVKSVSETKTSTHIERTLHIWKQGQEGTMKVTQFVCSVWKSKGIIPDSCSQFLSFMEEVDSWQRQSNNRPIIPHCLDGAERSGLFCVIWCVLDRVTADREVAIHSIVRQMRICRQQIVPNFEQYQFCHDIVVEYLTNCVTYTNV